MERTLSCIKVTQKIPYGPHFAERAGCFSLYCTSSVGLQLVIVAVSGHTYFLCVLVLPYFISNI